MPGYQKTTNHLANLIVYLHGSSGHTIEEIATELGVGRGRASGLVKALRTALRDTPYNLVCVPQGWSQPWLYYFAKTLDDSRVWRLNRTSDLATRLETLEDVIRSIVLATDPLTVEGRAIRSIERTIGYVQGEVAALVTATP